ncbi:MAG TPA: AAA family ATPase [Candidatus Saccharimonadales bacterium]|jgi:hypothetical protein|nr:AAA family ATPase [Candidatus Saccharimonadales bacterium]
MSAILEQIREWANGLKYWEQAALEKIAAGVRFTDEDYKELATLWEQDAGLAAIPSARPPHRFSSEAKSVGSRPKCRLLRLYNLNEVNALPQSQELPFCPQLTLIFGANGAGKTGYARPLGCAAFARGDRDVLPNAEHDNHDSTPSACFEIIVDGHDKPVQVDWQAGRRCPELSGFYVFDAESVDAHLVGQNIMSVTPSALRLLTQLADETDEVRRRIRLVIDQRNSAHTFSNFFQEDSIVSKLVANLGPETDRAQLAKLATMTEGEEIELKRLGAEVAQLRLQTIAQSLRVKRQELSDLEGLFRRLREVARFTDLASVTAAEELIRDLQESQHAADQFGAHHFACELLTQVGTEIWRDFVEAARELAAAEEMATGTVYPQQGAPCLLCQQQLPTKAVDLINRLWQFLASDAQTRLGEAQSKCARRVRELQNVPLNYFSEDSSVRRLLELNLPASVLAIEAHADSAAARIKELADGISEAKMGPLSPLVEIDTSDLLQLIEILKRDIRVLESSKEGERLAACEQSFRELQHRKTLSIHLQAINNYVDGRMWASQATSELGTTGHITSKYNKLFDSLVTEKYKIAFQLLLDRFGRNLRVSVETKGRKGLTVRQVALNRSDFPSGLPIAKVLSDGEKRAVALADFIAEATTDESCDGLILDDPVTSFDADWKKELANYLAEYAGGGHQVVIFTHDLPFLHEVNRSAIDSGLEVASHWVQKRDNRPGFLFVNNSPVSEKDFKVAKYAEQCWQKSKDLGPAEQQLMLEQGFGALRTSYEALVIFGLFNSVVQRFDERLRLDLLAKVNFDNSLAAEISARWAQLSRYIDAHLHSDLYAPQKPTPEMLRNEINLFIALKKKVDELKKAQS